MLAFHIGPAPKGFKPDFESFLFNTRPHRLTQSKTKWKEFHLVNPEQRKILASVAFHVQNKIARSPFKAPFGSYELSSTIRAGDFLKFIAWVDHELKNAGATQIEVINPPSLYTPRHHQLIASLLVSNYQPTQCDLGCSIMVSQTPLIKKMNKGKQKQFRHGVKAGFVFKKLSLLKLSEVYSFIETCRKERKQSLSLSLKELEKIIKMLPKAFHLFVVSLDKKIITASICVRVNTSTIYTFYSAHSQAHDSISPLVFLLAHLYDWCRENGITLLDMGTSTLRGKPNFNLLDFKLRVGGTLSPKFTFQKKL